MTGPVGERSQPEVWRAVWDTTRLTKASVQKTIHREQRTLRWKAIRRAFIEHFGTLEGVRTIELGAGTGDISLLLALEGARPTLFDANEQALELARFKFSVAGITPDVCVGDFLNLDAGLLGTFDATVSYGTVEHFAGRDRYLACRAHTDVIRPGGMIAISVPNAHCLPYRLNKWWQERRGVWVWGLEIPYSRRELFDIARSLDVQDAMIHGSSFLRDWDQFLFNRTAQRIERFTGFHFERRTPFDPYWGHALTLIGARR